MQLLYSICNISGANDILAVEDEAGQLTASPFSVQFGEPDTTMTMTVLTALSRQEGHLAAPVRARGEPPGQQPRRAGQHGAGQRRPRILLDAGPGGGVGPVQVQLM